MLSEDKNSWQWARVRDSLLEKYVGNLLKITFLLLPTANCLLPTAYCLLPTAIFILVTPLRRVQTEG